MVHYSEIRLMFIAGTDIGDATKDAMDMCRKTGLPVVFDFNGSKITVEQKNRR